MEDLRKRQIIAMVIPIFIAVVLTVLISLSLWQMWSNRAAFGIFAPPFIIANMCIIFVATRFCYSCHKIESGERFYRKIVDSITKYLWLKEATAQDIYRNNCASTECHEWHCSCCYKKCQFGCSAITEQPVYIWIFRVLFAIVLYQVWIFVFFCFVFLKFETAMFESSSTFLFWLRSNAVTPIDHPEVPYGLMNVSNEEVAFIANILKETHIYPDNNGPDALGLTHHAIEIDHIYRVLLSKCNQRYMTYMEHEAQRIIFPAALTRNPYPGKANTYPVLVSHYITPQIKKKLSLDTNKEVLLFHGTKKEHLDSILRTGLQSGKSAAGLYGKGIYLADSSQKADRYADFRNKTRMSTGLTMFVVRAAFGDLQVYDRHHKTNKAVVGGLGLDGHTRFREFIVKEDKQCCIEYVVHYHRVN